MRTSVQLSKRDVVVLASAASLANELFQSGVISEQELKAMLDSAWADAADDRAAEKFRNRANPTSAASYQPQEPTMNPKLIIQSIERNHAVMDAHLQKLDEISPAMSQLKLSPSGDTSASVSQLLNTAVRAHLQGAADVMHAMADIENKIRTEGAGKSVARQADVIDVEAVLVETKE